MNIIYNKLNYDGGKLEQQQKKEEGKRERERERNRESNK